jgi:hypothetical protein
MGERAHGAAVSATKWLNRIAQGFSPGLARQKASPWKGDRRGYSDSACVTSRPH